jgi:transposase
MAAARGLLDDAVALSRQADSSWYSAYPPLRLAQHTLVTGDWAAASTSIQEALALAAQADNRHALRWAVSVMAELDILEGRAKAARARLVPLLDQSGVQKYDVTLLLPMLAWAQLELGEVEQAAQTVAQALERARPEEMRLVLVEALRVQALIALRQERWDEAAHSLQEGLTLARGLPYPYAEARFLDLYGKRHVQKGEAGAARERLEAALAIFQRLGARPGIAQTERTLAALSQNAPVSQNAAAQVLDGRVTEAQWARIAALLPSRAHTGRPRADDRRALEAILYKQRTGCAWADLPAEMGDEATAHRRWRAWQAAGLWEPIVAIVQAPPAPAAGRPAGTQAPAPVDDG